MTSRLWVGEFTDEGNQYVAVGQDRNLLPVYKLTHAWRPYAHALGVPALHDPQLRIQCAAASRALSAVVRHHSPVL